MRQTTILIIIFTALLLLISGCAEQAQEKAGLENKGVGSEVVVDNITKPQKVAEEPAVLGPAGCKSDKECISYCMENPFDCKAWCDVNKEFCEKRGITIDIPSGIPGSPCAVDSACISGLICLDFKCDIPSPDNIAKKSGFTLPGGCTSMESCAKYCEDPKNNIDCLKFCGSFPSFCASGRAASVPEECKSCINCNSKNCILDCTYNCYQYMVVEEPDVASLKQGFVFERNYKIPIKAVWEPGPANNRNGITYFVDDYKDIGVNTYSIIPKYSRDGNVLIHTVDHAVGEKADEETIANLIKAKKAGVQVVLVAHDLYDMFPDANKNEKFSPESYVEEVKATSLKWAKIAEDYKVEYFVPINEFEYILYENGYSAERACEITNKLYEEVIPKVREVFKGKIYCRVGGMDAKFGCMDFSQCDIFGFTYGFSSGANYESNFEAEFKVGEQLYEKYKIPYIMAESFALLMRGTTVSDCANLHKAGIAAYKETAKHGIGYTFMGLIQRDPINKNDCTITQADVVDDYKEFFKWLDKNK